MSKIIHTDDEGYQIISGLFVQNNIESKALHLQTQYDKALRANKIFNYSDKLLDNFKKRFYLGLPLSQLQKTDYANGRCFASALTLAMCFQKYHYVIADLQNVASKRFMEAYKNEDDNMESIDYEARELQVFSPSFMHAFLIIRGEELQNFAPYLANENTVNCDTRKYYVLDPSYRTIIEKSTYYDIFGVEEKLVYTDFDIQNSPTFRLLQRQSMHSYISNEYSNNHTYQYNEFKRLLDCIVLDKPTDVTDEKIKQILKTDIYSVASLDNSIDNYINEYLETSEVIPNPNYDFLPK